MKTQTTSEERTKSTVKETISWESVHLLSMDLAYRIRKEFEPNIIVGIERGGMIPASMIGYALNKKVISIKSGPLELCSKGPVLVVDDICDTGETFERLLSDVPGFPVHFGRTASLYCKPWSTYVPDYFAKTTDNWIVFPWEK